MIMELSPEHDHVGEVWIHSNHVRCYDDGGHVAGAGQRKAVIQDTRVPTWGETESIITKQQQQY